MAQYFDTPQGVRLKIPGAYANYTVGASANGLATSGVLMLVGESDAGPDYSLEPDLDLNGFAPDQLADVRLKYQSGPLVDAFQAAVSPATDADISAATFTKAIICKVNASAKAQSTITRYDSSSYGILADQSYGKLGNMINYRVTAYPAEVAPNTGSFAFLPPIDTVNLKVSVNGVVHAVSLSAATTPTVFVSDLNAAGAGTIADGGAETTNIVSGGHIGMTRLSTRTVTLTSYTSGGVLQNWPHKPAVGAVILIPTGQDASTVGSYVVTQVADQTLNATKLMDATGTPGTCTDIATGFSQAALVVPSYTPVHIFCPTANPIDGVGKSLEVAELTTGNDLLSNCCYTTDSLTKVAWISTSAAPTLVTAGEEYAIKMEVNRQADNVQESFVCGGEVAIQLSYKGAATCTINTTQLVTTTGNADALALNLADFPSLGDLAGFINSHSSGNYTCSAVTSAMGALPPTSLDEVTAMGIGTVWGASNGRIKIDGYRFLQNLAASSLVQLGASVTPVRIATGLPQPQPVQVSPTKPNYSYLSGGTHGAVATADYTAAIDELENVDGNFLVPLISADASVDKIDGLTDASSTYEIDPVNAYVKTHCIKMSALKQRHRRQGFCSKRGTFAAAEVAGANQNFFRTVMSFMDVKVSMSTGIKQFRPWMSSVVAAATQAAAGYRPIFNKALNITGALQAAGDYNPKKISNEENALDNGLIPLKLAKGKGWTFVSDQTTYCTDNNPVYNSIQAVYTADIISATCEQAMENAFVGQSTADVDAALAILKLKAIFAELIRLKWMAKSDDAPNGYKNLKVNISNGVMTVTGDIKESSGIYFIPISFSVSLVQSSAG